MRTASTYTTREIRDATRAGWDGWLEDSPGGGRVLQSYEWGEFNKRQGWRPVRLVLERDGEVARAGQFLAYDTGPFVLGSLRYCTKGPWLPWEDEEAVRAFFEGVREVAGRLGAHTVKIEPEVIEEQKDTKALLGEIGFQKARYDLNHKTTIILDLRPSEEELLARMKGKTRYNVRLVARKGVGVEETGFKEAWDTFYGLLEGRVERNGFAIRRSHEYLHDSMRAMYDAGQGRFFFAAYEGELLAAISSSPSVRSAGTSTAPRATRGATSCLPTSCSGR